MCSRIPRLFLLFLAFAAAVPTAHATSAEDVNGKVLRGKVEARDHVVRLQRPQTPSLDSTNVAAKGTMGGAKHPNVDFGDTDFLNQVKEHPNVIGTNDHWFNSPQSNSLDKEAPLEAQVDDKELVIAWEAWHKRVCTAIYQNWLRNSQIKGVAHTAIHVSRDHRISVTITDIQLAPAELAQLPRGIPYLQQKLEQEFAQEVVDSVQPLNGSDILTFPAKSQRTETELHPYFKKMGEAGYDWRTDDFERVHVN